MIQPEGAKNERACAKTLDATAAPISRDKIKNWVETEEISFSRVTKNSRRRISLIRGQGGNRNLRREEFSNSDSSDKKK